MKKILLVLMVVIAVYSPDFSFAKDIEIKGISIGMLEEKFKEDYGLSYSDNLQMKIAGIWCKYPVITKWHKGKLDAIMFSFESKDFENMLSAIKSKYPKIKCENSKVGNAMGASFTQTTCGLTAYSTESDHRFHGIPITHSIDSGQGVGA